MGATEPDPRKAIALFLKAQVLIDSVSPSLESQRAIQLKNEEIENRGLQIANQRKTLWLLVVGVGLLGAIGVILYRQGVVRKRTNGVLVRLNDELSAANRVKAKFFAISSHDLRSPIAGLLNFLQLQKRKPGSMNTAEIAEYWDRVGGSASALLETMEAMLLWSKGQMEHFKPRVVVVEVADLFARLERLFARSVTMGRALRLRN